MRRNLSILFSGRPNYQIAIPTGSNHKTHRLQGTVADFFIPTSYLSVNIKHYLSQQTEKQQQKSVLILREDSTHRPKPLRTSSLSDLYLTQTNQCVITY